jgi:hypothetical protein
MKERHIRSIHFARLAQDEAVVEAMGDAQLLVLGVTQNVSQSSRAPEVEGCLMDASSLSGGNQIRMNRQIVVGRNCDEMVANAFASPRTAKIVHVVVGQIANRWSVAHRGVDNLQNAPL